MRKDAMELGLVYCICIYYEDDHFIIQIFTTVAFSKARERRFEFIPSLERELASKVVKESVVVEGIALQRQWIVQ
jgi:hypothetical protein